MNQKTFEILEKFVPKSYIHQGHQILVSTENHIRILLEKCKVPEKPWTNLQIENFLNQLAIMDSNNFDESCGLGEREGRVFSELVAKRHFHFAHGIGRSGDLVEVQPKAVGSSIINKLTNELVLDILKISGITLAKSCIVVPMATGMTLTVSMLSIRQIKPNAKYVLMPRIDQKSCIKSILAAGFTPIIIEGELIKDELCTNLKDLENKINEVQPENIACVFSVTSCFAPRAPDRVEEIAILCKKYQIFHLINNAYGLQSSKSTHMINQASRIGRVDVVIQSTDKNLMVPVGGSIIAAFDESVLNRISRTYPGRASSSQSLDILITLLSMGTETYKRLLNERKECFTYLKTELNKIAEKYNEKVLETPSNPISMGTFRFNLNTSLFMNKLIESEYIRIAFSLKNYGTNAKELTQIGSMLFTRLVSGIRVVAPGESKDVNGLKFENFGSHSNTYPVAYFSVASAIGIKKEEIDLFIKRLQKVLDSVKSNET